MTHREYLLFWLQHRALEKYWTRFSFMPPNKIIQRRQEFPQSCTICRCESQAGITVRVMFPGEPRPHLPSRPSSLPSSPECSSASRLRFFGNLLWCGHLSGLPWEQRVGNQSVSSENMTGSTCQPQMTNHQPSRLPIHWPICILLSLSHRTSALEGDFKMTPVLLQTKKSTCALKVAGKSHICSL